MEIEEACRSTEKESHMLNMKGAHVFEDIGITQRAQDELDRSLDQIIDN